MIVDAHHHLWDLSQRAYPWMNDAVAPIRRTFALADLEAALPPEVTQTVLVQATASLEESEALLGVAAGSKRIAGVVGWIDLTADAAAQIARLRGMPGGERLAGIRHQVHDEEDPQWLLRADVLAGLQVVAEYGMPYDLLVRTRELASAYEAAQRMPNVHFILDHAAKPEIARGTFEPWYSELKKLASLPNVSCKLSGLVTEAPWDTWTSGQILPYAQRILDAFGPQRVLFGSDWPVCLLAASYERVLELAQRACAGLTTSQCEAIFAANAVEIYGLDGWQSSMRTPCVDLG